MKAIIVDDEKKGRETLCALINSYCKEVEVVATAANITEAHEQIKLHHPDVVFLDIEMPNGNGFDLLEKFEEIEFQVIFTTAYDHYAIKALKCHAFDYILKPIDIDELRQAVENLANTDRKAIAKKELESIRSRKLDLTGRLGLPIKDGIVYLPVSDIIRVESDGSYSTFYTTDAKKYVISRNLKEFEDLLPAKEFFRSHKSHLINIKKVKKYVRTDGYFVEMEDGSVVEIARRKKDEFLQIMTEN
ncbi:MAG TPA: LytTR family DNA-binding domain-containing protein [Bacteroidia bacterium]|jgi:two-component system LytT family response regulator